MSRRMLMQLFCVMGLLLAACGGGGGGGGAAGAPAISGWILYGNSLADAIQGIPVTAGGKTGYTNNIGSYTIAGLNNGTYTVIPSMAGYTFSPPSQAVVVNGGVVNDINFTATAIPSTYTISGQVTLNGLGLSGVTVTLTSSGTTSAMTDYSGNYSFAGAQNGNYTLTPALSGYLFIPSSKTVTVSGANSTGNNFTASNSGSITGSW